jgi:hypothetical protein
LERAGVIRPRRLQIRDVLATDVAELRVVRTTRIISVRMPFDIGFGLRENGNGEKENDRKKRFHRTDHKGAGLISDIVIAVTNSEISQEYE